MRRREEPPTNGSVPFRRAVGWSFVMTGGQQITATLITFLLAGLLGPEVFGTVAMAVVYVAFVQMVVQQGLVPAIVQRPGLRRAHLDTAFALVMGTAGVLTVLSVLIAPWWADVNDLPQLRDVIWALAVTIPLKALIVVPEGILRRKMDFRSLAARSNLAALVGGVAGLVAAVAGAGVWALVVQQIVTVMVEVVTLWALTTWRPGRQWERQAARELLSFTAGSFVASVGAFVNNRGDALLIGLFFGPVAVGLYRLAARVVNVVVDVAARAIQQVALPELSKLSTDRRRFVARSKELLRTTAMVAFPAFGVLAGMAPTLTRLLGPDWEPATVPLQLLCLTGAVRSLGLVVGAMLQASGRPRLFAVITWSAAISSGAAFVLAGMALVDATVTEQVTGISVVRAVVFGCPLLLVNLLAIRRWLGIDLRDVARTVGPSALAAASAVSAGVLVTLLFDDGQLWVAWLLRPAAVLVAGAGVLWIVEPRVRELAAGGVPALRGRRLPDAPGAGAFVPEGPDATASDGAFGPETPVDPAPARAPVPVAPDAVASTTASARRRSRGLDVPQPKNSNAPSETVAMTARHEVGTLPPGTLTGGRSRGSTSTTTRVSDRGRTGSTAPRSYSMDLWETLRIVARRWTVSLPLAILAVVAVVAIPDDVGQEYTSEASLVFIPPNVTLIEDADGSPVLDPQNPFLRQSGAVAAMAQLVQLSVIGSDVRALVQADGLRSDYIVEVDRSSPIMRVEVTAGSPAVATGSVDYVVELIRQDLAERQDQVEAPDSERIAIQVISPTSPAQASTGAAMRLRLVVLVIGILLAVGAALFVEGAANWAARRRQELDDPDELDVPAYYEAVPAPPDDAREPTELVGVAAEPAGAGHEVEAEVHDGTGAEADDQAPAEAAELDGEAEAADADAEPPQASDGVDVVAETDGPEHAANGNGQPAPHTDEVTASEETPADAAPADAAPAEGVPVAVEARAQADRT